MAGSAPGLQGETHGGQIVGMAGWSKPARAIAVSIDVLGRPGCCPTL
jgi:hypothetical protein